ncbi:MAG: RNA polymerase sigma factor [Chloroflexota bacterium]|nr:RNA polymerase sigma factor [Chloroflexota bacterium]
MGAIAADVPVGSDDELVLAARNNTRAFGDLYERHQLAVYRYLRARGFDDDQAGDLTAATFERAMGNLHRFRTGGSGFLPWVLRISGNLATDSRRRKAASVRALIGWRGAEPAPDPAQLLIRDEEDRLLVERLRRLPTAQREAIVLRYAAGLTAAQIGELTGRKPAAAQKLITRALQALKEAYRDDQR